MALVVHKVQASYQKTLLARSQAEAWQLADLAAVHYLMADPGLSGVDIELIRHIRTVTRRPKRPHLETQYKWTFQFTLWHQPD